MTDLAVEPLAVYPAPDGAAYRLLTTWRGPYANRGTVVAELGDAHSLQLHFDLYAPATASLTVDGRSSSAATLQELSQDLCVYRWNPYANRYDILYRGVIGTSQDTVGPTGHTVNVNTTDYRAVLARRPLGAPLTFAAVDQFTIAVNLVIGPDPYSINNPAYDLGVAAPTLLNPDGSPTGGTTGVVRDRAYTGAERAGDMLNNLAAVANGFDWGCEPYDALRPDQTPTPLAQARVWYPQRGVAKAFVAEYGSTVASVSRTVDSTSFANWVRNDGTTDPDTGAPVYAVAQGDAVTNPQLHPEGWWPEGVSNPSTADTTTLSQQASGELGRASLLMPSYSLALMPGAWRWKTDAWLGDTIAVRIQSGRLNVDTQARIIQVDVTVNDEGSEHVRLTVARAVPTLADELADTQSRLDALSRR